MTDVDLIHDLTPIIGFIRFYLHRLGDRISLNRRYKTRDVLNWSVDGGGLKCYFV